MFDLADTITTDQLSWYISYHELEPFTFTADDIRTAIQAQLTAAVGAGGKNVPPLGKFVPQWDQPEPLRGKDAAAVLAAWAEAVNKRATKPR